MTTEHDANAELRQFFERAERLAEEKRATSDLEKELFAELKSRGHDAKAFREVLRLRRMKPDDRAAFEAMVDMYRQAGGL